MLHDSVVVVFAAAAVTCTLPREISLAMITIRKSGHGFPFFSYMDLGLRLAARIQLTLFLTKLFNARNRIQNIFLGRLHALGLPSVNVFKKRSLLLTGF